MTARTRMTRAKRRGPAAGKHRSAPQRADAAAIADDPSIPPRLRIARREVEVGSLQGLRRALTFVADAILRGKLSVAKGNAVTYTLSAVGRVMEVELLERRVEALEKADAEHQARETEQLRGEGRSDE